MHNDVTQQIQGLQRVIDFLRSVGLTVVIEPGANGFVRLVRIVDGCLHVDPACAPSALLHEAGHLAIVPERFRAYMSDNLQAGIVKMFDHIELLDLHSDHPLQRAALQCSDPEATAWAWAAGLACGLTPEQIILDHEYGGSGAEIRSMLLVMRYAGIHGLAHAGMCRQGFLVPKSEHYPAMRTWLQPA